MSDASDILELAKKRYKTAVDGWQKIYAAAKNDLDFMSDNPGAMWDSSEFNSRATVGRPVPQIDQLTQFKHQVVNDIRMNTPTINVIPADLESDPETAEILSARIKAIEYKSNADAAYDMAADFSVGCSIGFIRVDRQYVDDESFEQELIIKRVVNPLSIYIDPNSTEPDGSDAKYAFVIEELTYEEFIKQWPDAAAVSFGDMTPNGSDIHQQNLSIVEYFTIDSEENEFGLLPDGTKEPTKGSKKKYQSKRKMKRRIVRHYKMAGEDILEETVFPGKYIPIVPVYGEEAWNAGKRHLFSLIRKAKDAQRTFNLWKALETELLLKQQQAPVQAAAGQMRGFEADWEDPAKAMVLYYHQTDINGQPAPSPQRLQPPTIPTGVVNASQSTANNIREILGMYNAAAGKREGDASGVAIKQLEQSSDVGNFHFGDNLVKSITQVGKILVCAIPYVEDSERIVSIVDKEDNFKMIGINGKIAPEQERSYDFTKGKHDVRVTVGASYTTQRQQASELYQNTLKILPPEAAINVLDLVFKYQDTPGSEAMESRFKKMVDPRFLDEEDREEGQPDPQVQMLTQQIQQLAAEAQQKIATLEAELQSKQGDNALKAAELQIKQNDQKLKAQSEMTRAELDRAKIQLEAEKLNIEKQKVGIEAYNAQKEPAGQSPTAIKLDTTGFQIMKTPEQLALEQSQFESAQQEERERLQRERFEREQQAQELQAKAIQTQAVIDALANISMQLNGLTATISQPITVIRDEAGNLIGAQ